MPIKQNLQKEHFQRGLDIALEGQKLQFLNLFRSAGKYFLLKVRCFNYYIIVIPINALRNSMICQMELQ